MIVSLPHKSFTSLDCQEKKIKQVGAWNLQNCRRKGKITHIGNDLGLITLSNKDDDIITLNCKYLIITTFADKDLNIATLTDKDLSIIILASKDLDIRNHHMFHHGVDNKCT
ncbi:hypothetical protein MTR_0030s0200 [Medicago truncatula]|uniref:Uncharacterized protein n=1 Tax=Medicago truncatula TaxID=3880 RepID=A0A072TUK0_MEDTR|nr:hypothetical protein MTR_0030s0200 [Medicago truncatula]